MPFLLVDPDDDAAVASAVDLLNAARAVDDPDQPAWVPGLVSGELRHGWDLEPDEMSLFVPERQSDPVGVLELNFPRRDNLHLAWAAITVHPDHRHQGHGSAMLAEVIRRARAVGRTTVWLGAPEDDLGAKAFVERSGFRFANHDARRHQLLADLDAEEIERLHHQAVDAATGYLLERATPPIADDVLEELVEVTAAINDAPMGDLTFEDEHFDLKRLQDFQAASAGRGERLYRIWARHRDTGEIGGHTVVSTHPLQPRWGFQGDTTVRREHRGHRLGLLLKIEMLRWLAEVEPQIEEIITYNQADNTFMISVNEALGYRLSRTFATYELTLDAAG